MRRIIAFILIICVVLGVSSCEKKQDNDENGELVFLEDDYDINLALADPDTLNPLETTSVAVESVMNIVYEPLFTYDEKINAVPVLAESYSISEDGHEIRIKLGENIKWHDGTVFTADDVIYTLSKLVRSNGLYKRTAEKISSFTALSRDEVLIRFYKPELDFSYNLTFPILSRNTRYVSEDFVPMGTGEYRFDGKSGNELIFVPNDGGQGDAAPRKKVRVKILRDNTAVIQAFNVNETDAITTEEIDETGVAPKSSSQAKQIASKKMVFLGFNTANEKLLPDIRRAIELMLDKQQILEKNAYGYGMVCDISVNPASWAYESADITGYTPEYVAKLLEHSNYILQDGIYSDGENSLSFEITVNSDNEKRVAVANTIAENLNGVGFDIKVKPVSYSEYIEKITNSEYDMFVGEVENEDMINPLEMLTSSTNYFNFDASGLLPLQRELYGTVDKDEYKSKVREIMKVFTENPPYIPLYFKTVGVVFGANVSGITEPILLNRYKNVGKWYFNNAKTEGGEKENE